LIIFRLLEQVVDQFDDRLHGAVDDRRHGFREPDPLVDRRGFAADDEHPADGPVDADALGEPVEHAQHGPRLHAVSIERGPVEHRPLGG
jgi:hypothetical protein